jgi:hypothetical protein
VNVVATTGAAGLAASVHLGRRAAMKLMIDPSSSETVIVIALVALLLASCALTVNALDPVVVGVPLMVEPDRVKPGGRLPETIDQV